MLASWLSVSGPWVPSHVCLQPGQEEAHWSLHCPVGVFDPQAPLSSSWDPGAKDYCTNGSQDWGGRADAQEKRLKERG